MVEVFQREGAFCPLSCGMEARDLLIRGIRTRTILLKLE
jgi:hypothetical protein